MDAPTIKQTVLEAFNFRHACQHFDRERKISDEDFAFMLECARLSPSSFGMQGCRYIVITSDDLKLALKGECWNQDQIDSCSHLVVFTTRTKDLEPGSNWVKSRFADREMEADAQDLYYSRYSGFHADLSRRIEGFFRRGFAGMFYSLFHFKRSAKDLYQWAARQCYIPLGNMMSVAAMLGIDSCAIEGFDKNGVEKALDLDTSHEEVVVICTFGYRIDPAPERKRLAIEAISEFR